MFLVHRQHDIDGYSEPESEPENYVRLCADKGEPMLALLRHERKRLDSLAFVDQLLSGSLRSEETTTTTATATVSPPRL